MQSAIPERFRLCRERVGAYRMAARQAPCAAADIAGGMGQATVVELCD
ncbi:MAG: hypothetical protein IJ751_04220 [Oscillospiraceae bacterium]|nr:hypothetical protein [Oscillospiraceae bacterium]